MKLGIIFTGHNSQFVTMAKDFYDNSRVVQDYFEEAYNCLGINFVKLCFASSDSELKKIQNSYLSILLVNSALFSILKELGIKPEKVAGYGVPGFFSAAYAVNGFSFPDGLYLLKKFLHFYEEQHACLQNWKAVKIDNISLAKLQSLCEKWDMHIVSVHSKSEFIVLVDTNNMQELKEAKEELSFTLKEVDFELGVYSPLINDIADQFKVYLEKVDFKDTSSSIISNTNSKNISKGSNLKKEIIEQFVKPIAWEKVLKQYNDMDLIIEVGPKEVFSRKLREMYPDKKIVSFNKTADVEEIKSLLAVQKVENTLQNNNVETAIENIS